MFRGSGYCFCQGIRGLKTNQLSPQPMSAYREIPEDIGVTCGKKGRVDDCPACYLRISAGRTGLGHRVGDGFSLPTCVKSGMIPGLPLLIQ